MRKNYFVALGLSFVFLAGIPLANARQTSNSIETGYVHVLPDAGHTAPAGIALFGLRNEGVLITEAGVPSTAPAQSGRIFVDIGGIVNTGIVLANPNDQEAVIAFYFTDASGTDFGAGSLTLEAHCQIAAFLTEEPFNAG